MSAAHGNTSWRTVKELAEAEVLIQLSRQPGFLQTPNIDPEDEDWQLTDEETEMFEAADILVSISQDNGHVSNPFDGPEFPALPVPSALSSPSNTIFPDDFADKPWFHHLLRMKPLSEFVRLALRTSSLDEEAERRIEVVLTHMTARNCVQEAIWYLEEFDWDTDQAIMQYEEDEAERLDHPSPLYAVVAQAACPITRANYDPSMLRFEVTEDTTGQLATIQFPYEGTFDVNNDSHLNALNQWRSDLTRQSQGLPAIQEFPRSGYTVHEERFLRNRYASRISQYSRGRHVGSKHLLEDFNKVFVGRYLPYAMDPCGPRKLKSVASTIDRNWKRDGNGQRAKHRANYHAARRVLAIRRQEQIQYNALMPGETADPSLQQSAPSNTFQTRSRGQLIASGNPPPARTIPWEPALDDFYAKQARHNSEEDEEPGPWKGKRRAAEEDDGYDADGDRMDWD